MRRGVSHLSPSLVPVESFLPSQSTHYLLIRHRPSLPHSPTTTTTEYHHHHQPYSFHLHFHRRIVLLWPADYSTSIPTPPILIILSFSLNRLHTHLACAWCCILSPPLRASFSIFFRPSLPLRHVFSVVLLHPVVVVEKPPSCRSLPRTFFSYRGFTQKFPPGLDYVIVGPPPGDGPFSTPFQHKSSICSGAVGIIIIIIIKKKVRDEEKRSDQSNLPFFFYYVLLSFPTTLRHQTEPNPPYLSVPYPIIPYDTYIPSQPSSPSPAPIYTAFSHPSFICLFWSFSPSRTLSLSPSSSFLTLPPP